MTACTILWIDDFPFLGGAQIAMFNLFRNLDPNRFRIEAVVPGESETERVFTQFGIHCHNIDLSILKINYRNPKKMWSELRRLRSLIHSGQYSLIHVNSLWTLQFTSLAMYGIQIPLLASIHAFPIIHNSTKRTVAKLLMPMLKKRPDAILAVSYALKKALVDFGFSENRIVVLPNGIDTALFRPDIEVEILRKQYGIRRQNRVVITVGRFHPGKGQLTVINVCQQLMRKYPELHLIILGEEYPTELENLRFQQTILQKIAETDMADRIHLAGFVQEPAPYYALADFVLSASQEETFGMSLLEAAACGTPVIAYHTGGIPELVGRYKTGILVPVGQPAALKKALQKLMDQPKLADHLGANGRQAAINHFDIKEIAARIQNLYESLI